MWMCCKEFFKGCKVFLVYVWVNVVKVDEKVVYGLGLVGRRLGISWLYVL